MGTISWVHKAGFEPVDHGAFDVGKNKKDFLLIREDLRLVLEMQVSWDKEVSQCQWNQESLP